MKAPARIDLEDRRPLLAIEPIMNRVRLAATGRMAEAAGNEEIDPGPDAENRRKPRHVVEIDTRTGRGWCTTATAQTNEIIAPIKSKKIVEEAVPLWRGEERNDLLGQSLNVEEEAVHAYAREKL